MLCSICLEEFRVEPCEKQPYVLPCTHIFHIQCIKDSSKQCGNSCPNCRAGYSDMISEAKLNMAYAGKIEKIENNQIQIFIKNMEGETTCMFVKLTDTEKKLHSVISAETGISPDQLRLYTGTKNIYAEGDRMLSDLGILKLSTIFVMLRLKGGMRI